MTFKYSISLDYNPSGITYGDKWRFLAGGPYSFQIQNDGQAFTIIVRFNYGENYPSLSVIDSRGQLVQGETPFQQFPTNLVVAESLKNIAIYWLANLARLDIYEIDDASWYNSATLTADEAYEIISRQSFVGAIE